MELTSKDLRKMSIKDLEDLANIYATKLTWLHSTGKDEEYPEKFKRTALELRHIAAIIDFKILNKPQKKYSYGKK